MTPADLQRIAFVTRRFEALQGLRWAASGAALLIVVAVMQVLPGWTGDPRLYLFVIANTVSAVTPRVLDDYYRATFGTVRTGKQRYQGGYRLGRHSEGLALVVLCGLAVDATDLAQYISVPSVAALTCICGSLWLLVREWPHRAHYLLGVAGGVVAWAAAAQAPPSPEIFRIHPAAAAYYLTSCSVIGLVLFACGLLDHRLLARAMALPNRARCEDGAGRYQGKLRAQVAATALLLCGVLTVRPVTEAAMTGRTFLFLALFMVPFLLWGLWHDMTWSFRAYSELTRAREARLLARITGGPDAKGLPEEPAPPRASPPDLLGHLVLPVTMAVGLLVDAAWRTHALPSLAALALAASHSWIVFRDWPFRKHYVLGVLAGLAVAMHHITIGSIRPMDWALRSVVLVSAAMLVEGLLDHHLESRHTSTSQSEAHANTV